MNLLEGKKDITSELKEKFVPTFAASCCFWPAAQVSTVREIRPLKKSKFVHVIQF